MAKGVLVFVVMGAPYADVKYGFRTTQKVNSAIGADLGHQALVSTTPVEKLIFGANYPKPRRATKKRLTGSETSFVAFAKEVEAAKSGYEIFPAKTKGLKRNTQRQKVLYVSLNGIHYAWAVSNDYFTAHSKESLTALGVTEVGKAGAGGAIVANLVFGATFPKPPKAIATASSGTKTNPTTTSVRSMCDPEIAAAAGMSLTGGSYKQEDLLRYVRA